MKMREYDYIKGNNVVNPQRQLREETNQEYEKLKKAKKQRQLIINNKKAKLRRGVTQIILMVLFLGMVTIYRDSQVYNIQKSISKINTEINAVSADNEALNLNILKASALGNVREAAETRLGMIAPKKEDVIKVNLSESNFNIAAADANAGEAGVLAEIMDALW
ncbi:MAG: hypothetical protein ABRQ25_01355 [Clostridiaceae bacterium]